MPSVVVKWQPVQNNKTFGISLHDIHRFYKSSGLKRKHQRKPGIVTVDQVT